jgi:hypothetical protein
MTQVLEKQPCTNASTGSRFYLLAVSGLETFYWEGMLWSVSKKSVKVFPSYEAAELEKPHASRKAPQGFVVIISPELD